MPRGFVSDLSSLIVSPRCVLLTNRNAYEERILRETQSFVYTLNSEVQTEYIRSNSHFLDVLVSGGKARGARPHLRRARPRRHAHAHRGRSRRELPADSPARKQLDSVTDFAGQASAALGLAHQALASTAHPVRLVQRSTSGRSYLLGSQVQSYGLGISLAFVTLLLGAAVLTLERDENVLARLLRSGTRPAAADGREDRAVRDRRLRARAPARARLRRRGGDLVLGRRLGAHPAAASSRSRPPARRSARSAASWARPRAICARPRSSASRSSRRSCSSASCRAQVSPLAAGVSELLPFAPAARAFGATLFDAAPLTTALAASGHLLLLTAVLGAATRGALQSPVAADEDAARLGRDRAHVASGSSARDARGDLRRPARRAPTASVLGPAPESVQP